MHFWQKYLWIIRIIFDFALGSPSALITFLLFRFVGAMFYRHRSDLSGSLKRVWVGCGLQFVLSLATIGVAAHGELDWTQPTFRGENQRALRAENYLIVLAAAIAPFAVARAKGSRGLAISLMLLQLWLLACAYFVAGMALTGRWL